jgi:hypothetical protein
MKFRRKKYTDVEAFKMNEENISSGNVPDWFIDAVGNGEINIEEAGGGYLFRSEHGLSVGTNGMYAVKNSRGCIYPASAEIFEELYEVVK